MATSRAGSKSKAGSGSRAKAARKPRPARKPIALREENLSYETDYFAASGAALLPSEWTLQLAFLTPMLDERKGIINTADMVVSIPWPLAKALAKALKQVVEQHDPTPLPKDVEADINKNGGLAPSLVGSRRA